MQIDNNRLKQLVPINQLHRENRLKIANQSNLKQLSAGDELTANQEQRWFTYLLKGKLDLCDVENHTHLVQEDDERALHPLFAEGEDKTSLVAQSQCVVLQLDKQLFHNFIDQEMLGGDDQLPSLSEVEGLLYNEILEAFNAGDLALPCLSDVAQKVRASLKSPGVSLDQLANIISAEPTLAIRLIQVANNHHSEQSSGTVTSLQGAIQKLGLETSRELAGSLALRNTFNTRSELLNARMHQVYDRALDVACLSHALSEQTRHYSPDHLFLAGMVHEIGVIPILHYIETTGLLVSDEAELEGIISNLRKIVGGMVVRQWNLPDDIFQVIEAYEGWSCQSGADVEVSDIVIVAQIYHHLKHHKLEGLRKINQVPAFRKLLGDRVDKDFAGNIFALSHIKMASILKLLKL